MSDALIAPWTARQPIGRIRRLRVGSRGISLIEAMVGLTILTAGLLTLTAVTSRSIRRSALSAVDARAWSNVGRVADSLTAVGWGGLTSGSETHPTHSITWSVSSPAGNLDRVDVVIARMAALGQGTRQDSLVLLLSRAAP